jgi:hypothetical protein
MENIESEEYKARLKEKIQKSLIFKYISFKTSDAFEQWQIDNPHCQIHSINPIASHMNISVDPESKDQSSYEGDLEVSVFVLYH